MYSRYSDRPEKGIQIPEHYSGCAFSGVRPDLPPPQYLGVAKPSPAAPVSPAAPERDRPPVSSEKDLPPVPSPRPEERRGKEEASASQEALAVSSGNSPRGELPLPFGNLFSHLGGSLPFSKGLDFDQLLILGLILLLLKNDRDSDVILWLGLLLLCG